MTPLDYDVCDACGKLDIEHSFKQLLVCLYADQGMTPAKAQTVVDNLSADFADPKITPDPQERP